MEKSDEIDSKIHSGHFTYEVPPRKIACGVHHSGLAQPGSLKTCVLVLCCFTSLESLDRCCGDQPR